MNFKYLDLVITNRCNFRCGHCIIPDYKGDLPFDKFQKLWEKLKETNSFALSLTGGEPFLNKDLVKIASIAREKGCTVEINSNGSCIDKKTLKELNRIGVFAYQISVYGASPETYKLVTGSSQGFYETRKGIHLLLENGAHLILKMTITKKNFKDVKKINDYFLEIQNDYGKNRIRILFTSLIYPKYDGDIRPLEHMVSIDQQVKLARNKHVNQFILPHRQDLESPLCNAGVNILHISVNGDVYPCNFFCVPVGNIFQQSLEEIWHESDFLKKLRKRNPKCISCKYFKKCIQCPGLSYYFHKDINKAPETICRVVKAIHEN